MAAPIFVADEIVTAAKMNSLPKGVLGYAQVTANQASITTEVDLTGLAVTVDVTANRRIRISGHTILRSNAADAQVTQVIKESTTQLQFNQGTVSVANKDYTAAGAVIITPSAGSHTYKLAAIASGGTGTLIAAAAFPAFILVEDLGSI